MKTFYRLVLISILCFGGIPAMHTAFAQETSVPLTRHQLDVGYGAQFLGSGDVLAQVLQARYDFYFSERLAFSLMGQKGSVASFREDGQFSSEVIWTIDPMFTLLPFPNTVGWMSVSLGPSFRSLKSITGAGYVRIDDGLNSQNFGSINSDPTYREELAIGLTTMINIRVFQKNHFLVCLHPMIQSSYTNGDIASGVTLSLGFQI